VGAAHTCGRRGSGRQETSTVMISATPPVANDQILL
jgi:hypothetical protein